MSNDYSEKSLKQKGKLLSHFNVETYEGFNPILGKPYNIDKVTLQQIDNLNITYIFTTGRSASTLLGVMLMMSEEVIFTSEEIFPVILKQKYGKIQKWTEQLIKEYCNDFVLLSEGKLYPLFCGKDVLFELLMKFKEHLNYERVIRISYLAFGVNKDLSKVTTIVDKQLRYYLSHHYLELFPSAKILLLVRDPRDNVYSKYNRAIRKKIKTDICLYIYTWKSAFKQYFSIIKKYNNPYLIINYEKLINDSVNTMKSISNFISINYTENFFNYPATIQYFLNQINHPKLLEHFLITHKSLTQPISPQKVNEWQKEMNNKNISDVINATWKETKEIAERLNYLTHNGFVPLRANCLLTKLKVNYQRIASRLYFNYFPYSVKKWLKQRKYPYRISNTTAYDKFLRKGYL